MIIVTMSVTHFAFIQVHDGYFKVGVDYSQILIGVMTGLVDN